MTEMAKTVFFIAAAAVSLVVAFVVGPSGEVLNVEELVGMRLNQFEVDVAKRLRIVKFDQETASTREFEVAESDGLWSIPSKQNYPADAARQMAAAATCLIDREVLRVAGKSANDHETLGVIDPGASSLDSKAEGVGIRVTITDANDETLADMIIGKPVKDAEGQYYVRNADQDVVYVVSLDPEKLSTKFEDWIEDDLLKLNPRDIRRVSIKDYSAEMRLVLVPPAGFARQVSWDSRGEFDLRYDDAETQWIAERLQKFDPEKKELVEFQLAENEELAEDALNELKAGLDDLLLVDVERKPTGLSGDLKAGENFLNNQEANDNLINRGFAPVARTKGAEPEILSSEGEIVCTLQDGVEYVLRFGNLQLDGEAEAEEKSAADAADASDEETAGPDAGVNRYLFVMARFNESMLEKPELEELPELPESATEDDDETASDEESEGEEQEADGEDSEEDTEEENTEKENPEKKSTEEKEELADLIAAREMIEKENQRRLNEYQDKIKSGKDRVSELNSRFGDWYYVIANDVYKKIHLSRDEVIVKKESEDEKAEGEAPAGGIPGLPNLPLGGAGGG